MCLLDRFVGDRTTGRAQQIFLAAVTRLSGVELSVQHLGAFTVGFWQLLTTLIGLHVLHTLGMDAGVSNSSAILCSEDYLEAGISENLANVVSKYTCKL